MRWALDQAVEPALTKFCLIAMADCVNAEGAEVLCWPSYAHIARRTGMNSKTVEASVYRLKQLGYIVDTGRRAGDTGKVVIYRLNDPKTGAIQPGPQTPNANGTRPLNDPNSGVIGTSEGSRVIPPNPASNPPKNGGQSPQKVEVTTPKAGDGISKGTRKGTRKEPGIGVAAVSGVAPKLLADWLVVRKDKKAGTLTETAVAGLAREAAKAGLTVEEAVRYCIEANWISFTASFYANREGRALTQTGRQPPITAEARNAEAMRLLGIEPSGTQEIIDA
jgi:hypothetical protein